MIVSISDTVHIVQHYKEALGRGVSKHDAIVDSMKDSAIPCLLTEITIAGGFVSLVANDMVMIQQFGIVTAAGMLLTWFANVTVLPLALSFLRSRPVVPDTEESAASRRFRSFVRWIERTLLGRPRAIVVVTAGIVVLAGLLASRAGKEYYAYDDLRPDGQLAQNLRYVEQVHGGTVPMAVYIESPTRAADAMLEPKALALIDRIGTRLEQEFPHEVKNASSLAKV